MKNISLIFILIICVSLGIFRYLDLTYFTDENGFVTVLNSSIRYIAFVIPVALVILHSVIFSKQRPKLLNDNPLFIFMFIVGLVHVFSSIFSLIVHINSGYDNIDVVLIATMFLTGIWFSFTGFASIVLKKIAPGNILFAILGAMYYYILMLYQFVTTVSSVERISAVIEVLAPMTVVIFITTFIKQVYFLSRSVKGITVSGVVCFLFAGCITFAETAYGIKNGTLLPVPLMQNISCISVGIIALYATFSFSSEQSIDKTPIVY